MKTAPSGGLEDLDTVSVIFNCLKDFHSMRQTSLNKTIYFLVGEPVCTSILDDIMVVVHANPV